MEGAKGEGTAENFKKLMTVWTGLGAKEKAATQKSVLWAYCAMLWSKGHAAAAQKRQGTIDYPAFLQAVTDPCKACNGRGHNRTTCRHCGGSGMQARRCRPCGGSGTCSFCRGSGKVGGLMSSTCSHCGGSGSCSSCTGSGEVQLPCPNCSDGKTGGSCQACGGTGRVYSEFKCKRVVEENLEDALRICHGERVEVRRNERHNVDDFGWGDE